MSPAEPVFLEEDAGFVDIPGLDRRERDLPISRERA
jgi:hypothetical protein